MPIKLDQVFARVGANDEPDEGRRGELRRVVLETIAACGLLVNTRTGEVYNPAPVPSSLPRQQNVRWSGGRRGR